MSKLITVIMAGGRGERLWPKSSNNFPKQFSKIVSDKTMLEETMERCRLLASMEKIYISTLKQNLPIIKKILPKFPSKNIIQEPMIRDTACAILLSVLSIPAKDEDIMLFVPADHYLKQTHKFKNDILTAFRNTQSTGRVTLVGITPTHPSTEYGYLKVKTSPKSGLNGKKGKREKILTVEKFVEKPQLSKAKLYLKSGQYLWNSGMFMFNRKYLLGLFQQHTPELYRSLTHYLQFKRQNKSSSAEAVFKRIKKISFDYAIAEKITDISCVSSSFFWDDVGNWESLFRIRPTDSQGNIVIPHSRCFLKDSHNNLCIVDDEQLLVLNGVNEMIIVSKDSKIYMTHRQSAGNIKTILKELESGKKKGKTKS